MTALPDPARRVPPVPLLVAFSVLGPVTIHMVLPALPFLQHEFGTDYATVQLLVSAFVLAFGGGQVLAAQDVEVQTMDLTPYPVGVFTQPEQVIGKTTASSISAGSPIRPESLRASLAIRQGQQVIVVAKGENFKVTSEGRAMGNATAGQLVAVKTKSGQIVKGVAKEDGTVEVAF